MVVVDDLDEGLHFAALGLTGFGHAAGHLEWVAFDASDKGVRERVLFAAVVLRLDDDDFFACVAAARDDGLGGVLEGDLLCGFGGGFRTTRPTLRTAILSAMY